MNILLAIRVLPIEPADGRHLIRADRDDRVGNYLMLGVGNYLIAPLGNYLMLRGLRLGNYLIADTLDDDPMMRRAAAKAIENACSSASLELTSEEMLSLVEATEGPGREVDAEAGSFLSSALSRARLGDDVALCLLYEMADSQPKASPDELFGDEKKDLLEHLTLYAKERDKGEHGWRGQIAQLDLIAERLGCAAYLKLGSKETLKQQIRTREKYAYGNVIGGLAAVARVSSAQAPLGVLRDLRSKKTQITHVGTSPGEADLVTAHQTFKSAAKTLLIALDSSGPTSR